MKFGRGHHTDVQTQARPASGEAASTANATDEGATPPIWWVKNILSWTLLAAALALLAALVVVPRLTGSTAYTVLTGSMQPTYPPGTLIVVKPTPGDQLKAGDVITFQPESGNPSVTTHRIVSIVYDVDGNRRFITKGDANNTSDEVQLVHEQIRGRLLYSVPYVGHINRVLNASSRSIMILVVAGGLGAYALWMWYSGFRDRGKSNGDAPPTSPSTSSGRGDEPAGPSSPSPADSASRGSGTGTRVLSSLAGLVKGTAPSGTPASRPSANVSGPLLGPPRPPIDRSGPHSQDFAQPIAGHPMPVPKQSASTCASCGSPTGPSSAITQPIPVIK